MTGPKFSVVIPTRNRCETLSSAIETVLVQKYEDLELIVCDNNSQDETKSVVERFDDARVKYINSGSDLSMTDNWNLALSEASGEYVILFGDDDGLLPDALSDLDQLLSKNRFDAISWERCFYAWPNMLPPAFANQLTIPLAQELRYWDSQNFLRDMIDFSGPYRSLPMLYSSVVKRSILLKMKKITGNYLFSINPDIYSGVSIAYLCKNFLHSMRPFSINGASAKSNGTAWIFGGKQNKVLKENWSLNRKSGRTWDELVPDIRSVPCAVIDGFQASRKRIFPKDRMLEVNKKSFLKTAILQAVVDVKDESEWVKFEDEILNKVKSDNNLRKELRSYLAEKKEKGSFELSHGFKTGITGNEMILDASDFGAANVLDASILIGKLIGSYKPPATTHLPKNERLVQVKNR
ncbi:glycosyltransferase involved in cell wall biogenesis [Moorena producens 3L]|uniref:Glycosyltransferase involved in cell wall biogenesis n=1 Tax=Moorena producens 3L TaxID=489825 RepID=F4XQA9_9CYAN|nr:glycosyltransferase family A protein [Moorena producens]EGJ33223.1 glycosyltransferase involved in cell wall biogenesis [Moorena producens 3L]OLT53573.1 hypothetical protein BI334_33105 [Moorena producens 3L]